MKDLPLTPDFEIWPIDQAATEVKHTFEDLQVTWSDGLASQHHVFLLRENSPDSETMHPLAREMTISPNDIPDDISIISAAILENGAIAVSFSDGLDTAYHPGWLRRTAWLGREDLPDPVLWKGTEKSEPPTFDGPSALKDPATFLKWLEALRDYGVARLRRLPQEDGLLEKIVTMIGPVRETNFGKLFVLNIKEEPDSQAYTSESLLQHTDIPTRESPVGVQFLYTRHNTTTGGEGIYVDGYRIAEDIRKEAPEHFLSLTQDVWEYNNRAKTSDYRGSGPVIETLPNGKITGIRYNTFLRAPLKAPIEVQVRAYRAYRAFCAKAEDPDYQMRFPYEPGDLLAFDNRRALHGRAGYDAKSGTRVIEGMYTDRDDLHSRIRSIRRQFCNTNG